MSAKDTTFSLTALCLLALVAGCVDRELSAVDPSTQSQAYTVISQTGTTKVDLLFVVDNSNSMDLEQEILSEQIVVMARELLHPTAVDGHAPGAVTDLHIGIISSDMGTGAYRVDTCEGVGDNGLLQSVGRLEGCQASYNASDCQGGSCPWLAHTEEHPDDGSDPANPPIWEDFGCLATLGTGGCGFEQPLEAALVALGAQSETGRANEGFLRDDSLLAIIFVSDEDDCSTPNQEMFNRGRDDFAGAYGVRCAMNPGQLYPIDRYVEGFRGLRPGREDNVVVASIVGVPDDGSWRPGDPIDQLREMVRPQADNPNFLEPSCDTELGFADPPVRFAELVYAFGNDGILESICRSDWTAALTKITNRIRGKLPGQCMPRELASTGADSCRVVETLSDDRPCPDVADIADQTRGAGWRLDLGTDEVNGLQRRRCEILPSDYDGDGCPDGAADCAALEFTGQGALDGWYYDNASPDCEHGQVRFTRDDVTADLSQISFECRTLLCPSRRQCQASAEIAEECDPTAPGACGPGATCVRHNSGEVCGWVTVVDQNGEEGLRARSCARCAPTLRATCPDLSSDWPAAILDAPLLGEGGCCAEGFHCEGGGCVPDRSTLCGASATSDIAP